MRIIAGEYRSRVIKAVEGTNTRPTTDKIKEAIFSRIGPYFKGGVMLDLFAGSGAMGLEGISRGIEYCYFADVNGTAIRTIYDNVRTLKVEEQCTVWKMDFIQVLRKCMSLDLKFDLIYIDPPYKKQENHLILETIHAFQLLNKDGIVIVESLKEDQFAESYGSIHKEKEAVYGITKITYYRKDDE